MSFQIVKMANIIICFLQPLKKVKMIEGTNHVVTQKKQRSERILVDIAQLR